MRRLAVWVVALSLVFTGLVPASAKDAWIPENDPIANSGFQVDWAKGNDLLLVLEEGNDSTSWVFARNREMDYFVCSDPGLKVDCGVKDFHSFGGKAILPACEQAIENCIESIEVSSDAASASPATLIESSEGFTFTGVPELGAPRGAGPLKFSSEVLHSGGKGTYAAIASLGFDVIASGAGRSYTSNEFSLRIFAVDERQDPRGMIPIVEVAETPDGKGMAPSIGGSPGCVYQVVGICAVEQEFAPGTEFKVSLILSNQVSGWFRGRLQDPVIDVQPINGIYNRVVISGDSVEVPRFLSKFSLAAGDPDIVGPPEKNSHGGQFTHFSAASQGGIDIVNGMRERVGDRATAVSRIWSINSINSDRALDGQGQGSQCLADKSKLLGIVTTNAMTYTGLVPGFENGFLSYVVAGLHYAPDGQTLNLGTYDLVMRSETARCLYGFSKAPVSATVTVVGEGGEENIATTVVNEKDGWLKLAAYGFTFSEKEIKVQITQPQSRTLSAYSGRTIALTAKQKSEIRAVVNKSKGNTEFICTALVLQNQSSSAKSLATKRAKAACSFVEMLNPQVTIIVQTKTTKAGSLNGRVLVSSR